ncbi:MULTISPECIES: dynamin family protein [unclassified Desulfovibrio]|uniref:dynamin family protein n=1 Tax=unclassified Desulfovibrio TaxID=2593640 RepID=UPI0013EC2707|nr:MULTISPECIES: dynamin family protein [unclassified Desulfovibrio]
MGFYDKIQQKYESLDETACGLDEAEALKLLGRLCSKTKQWDELVRHRRLSSCLSHWLPEILSRAGLGDPGLRQAFGRLDQLAASILENARLPMLRHKTVLGIGGAFSAGKSRFLNALTGRECLPEEQGPATAIGTYLVRGPEFSILAHTKGNGLEALRMEELRTISHKFHAAYKIGFADVLHKLVITSPDFLEHLVLLDTPGYTKPADGKALEAVDRRIAREHLKNSDYLIWLIDIGSGAITETDVTFLKELEPRNPFLVVFNKADGKSTGEIADVVRRSEDLLASKGMRVFGVTAYSSADKEEYLGRNLVRDYIAQARRSQPFSPREELAALERQWSASFTKQKAEIAADLYAIQDAVTGSARVSAILGMIGVYSSLSRDSTTLYYEEKSFHKGMEEFFRTVGDFL